MRTCNLISPKMTALVVGTWAFLRAAVLQAKVVAAAAAVDEEPAEEEGAPAAANYEYLLSMAIQSLTLEKARLAVPYTV